MNAQSKNVNGKEQTRKKAGKELMNMKQNTFVQNVATLNFMDYSIFRLFANGQR